MTDHITLADEIGVCPRCGAELRALAALCDNPECPSNKKEDK